MSLVLGSIPRYRDIIFLPEVSMLGASLLTPRQVAAILRCSRSEVHVLIASGELPSVLLGRRPRVPESGLRAWMERRAATRRLGGR